MYRNSEGYHDPTAGRAMSQAMKDYRKIQKENWNRQYRLKNRKKIYVVSPFAGDTVKNTDATVNACRFVIESGGQPIASHLMYPPMLNDHDPGEREMGLMFGLSLLATCDEIWVFGSRVSEGMKREMQEARRLGKKIRRFTEEMA